MATTATVRRLLTPTSLPASLVDELLAEASAVWLIGQSAESLAGDLVLCHPPLAGAEVRALARPTADPNTTRLTVVARDRPGLLAALTAVLADQRLSITDAAATVLAGPCLAVQRVTAVHADGRPMVPGDWDEVGLRLQAVLGRQEPAPRPRFVPLQPVTVEAQPQDLGRTLVTVEAPDRVGLLWAMASWFADHGCNVEAYRATTSYGNVKDQFVVVGTCDCADLTAAISDAPVETQALPAPMRFGVRGAAIVASVVAAITLRVLRVLHTPRPAPFERTTPPKARHR